jgi:predicted O-methyltransferase YrrM
MDAHMLKRLLARRQPPPAPAQPGLAPFEAYFAARHDEVPGFLTQVSAAGLRTILEVQERHGIRGALAEIGTYLGRTFVGLGLALRPEERLLGVDLFVHAGHDFEAELRANLRRFGVEEARCTLHRGPSHDLAEPDWRRLLGAPARLVHIDGDHGLDSVRHDLGLAVAHLAERGAILVDDVFHPWYPDSTTSVIDFLRAREDLRAVAIFNREATMMGGGPKLLIARAADEATYRDALLAGLATRVEATAAAFLTSRPVVLGPEGGAVR